MTIDTYRAEVIGSLLHPAYLIDARKRWKDGSLATRDYKRLEDQAAAEAIDLQTECGVDVVTDGEVRRGFFAGTFTEAIDGLSAAPAWEMSWTGDDDSVRFTLPFAVTEKLHRRRSLAAEEFTYSRGRTDKPLKVTLPSPFMMIYWWSTEQSPAAYPDPRDLFLDAARIVREEIDELIELGCTYVQIDAPEIAIIGVDEAYRQNFVDLTQLPADRILDQAADVLNEIVAGVPIAAALHLCRGNNSGRWTAAGSYDHIARRVLSRLTNFDKILLEYDDERSGTFEALRRLPQDKQLVLGLISTKRNVVEDRQATIDRIHEAASHYPLAQLAVSTQCGFASNETGNPIEVDVQRRKLQLVANVAHEVWG
jgi:5-methyltetrahydropteroyltriglutamate--homocysteine methyltransferase